MRTWLGREGSKENHSRRGSPGRENLGALKPTQSRSPNHCGNEQQPRRTRQGEGKTPTRLQASQIQNVPNRGYPVERRSLELRDRCKRGKGANITNGN